MISLGSTSVVGQAAAGLILMYTRTVRVGEYVRIGEYQGTVLNLGFFTTRVRTDWGDEVNLPNAMIVGMATRNYSRTSVRQGYLVDTQVTIGYDAPWRQVEAMLVEAARRTPGLLAEPRPKILQAGLADFYPVYQLVCLTAAGEARPRAKVVSALHRNVQDVFNEYGVQIMSRNYRGDPETPKVVPPARWYPAPAAPSGSDAAAG
jgi:small-conductance mechanosensitive channel